MFNEFNNANTKYYRQYETEGSDRSIKTNKLVYGIVLNLHQRGGKQKVEKRSSFIR